MKFNCETGDLFVSLRMRVNWSWSESNLSTNAGKPLYLLSCFLGTFVTCNLNPCNVCVLFLFEQLLVAHVK